MINTLMTVYFMESMDLVILDSFIMDAVHFAFLYLLFSFLFFAIIIILNFIDNKNSYFPILQTIKTVLKATN